MPKLDTSRRRLLVAALCLPFAAMPMAAGVNPAADALALKFERWRASKTFVVTPQPLG